MLSFVLIKLDMYLASNCIFGIVDKENLFLFQIVYDSSFLGNFSNADDAESWIQDSLEWVKEYYRKPSLGSTLEIQQTGPILYEDIDISIDIIKSDTLRNITLQKKNNAHMIVYYVGVKEGINGQSGCIGCICRPDRTVSRSEWTPQGLDPDFKHAIVEKTKQNNRQGKVRTFY